MGAVHRGATFWPGDGMPSRSHVGDRTPTKKSKRKIIGELSGNGVADGKESSPRRLFLLLSNYAIRLSFVLDGCASVVKNVSLAAFVIERFCT
ncbi:unnamed protein product [Anisakis simplex]|uniref:Uncharacterized protein n=1 Tax=Anisakis simplex TaxID=6269 RepID=A0A0M3JZJ1_ANISI|nr:unnamed protein product [Anisakis simplex]